MKSLNAVALIALATATLTGTAAHGAPDSEVLTVDGGVVCMSRYDLREAIVAANRGDLKWVRELGCVQLAAGIKAIRIDPYAGLGHPWQVRIIPHDGTPAVTVWGYASSFQTVSGRKFWPPK